MFVTYGKIFDEWCVIAKKTCQLLADFFLMNGELYKLPHKRSMCLLLAAKYLMNGELYKLPHKRRTCMFLPEK
jgi:hypothetical protein